MNLKIAIGNLLKHKLSTLVLIIIFMVSTFVIYWIFGFSNSFSSSVQEESRVQIGDISFTTDFQRKDKVNEIIKDMNFYKIDFESSLSAIMNAEKENSMYRFDELSKDRLEYLKKVKLTDGRLPENPYEIVISDFHEKPDVKVGEMVFLSTFTPDKVINTVKYTISGIGSVGHHNLITTDGIKIILDSDLYANKIKVYINEELTEQKELEAIQEKLRKKFEENGIKIEEKINIYQELESQKFMILIFSGVKIVLLSILFPLIGTVIAALVWIHAYKRRKELWTYVAIGFKDKKILNMIILEYLLIAVIGVSLGILLGGITSFIAENTGKRLSIGFIMSLLLVAKIGLLDILMIVVFYILNIFIWARIPLLKIIKEKPFSY